MAPSHSSTPWVTQELKNGVTAVQIGSWKIRANVGSFLEPEIHIHNKETGTVFSSHSETIYSGRDVYSGEHRASSKLVYLQQASPVFLEAMDQKPYNMHSRFKYYYKTQP